MIREEKHLISHAPYAVDLGSLDVETRHVERYVEGQWIEDPERPLYKCTIRAAWFRRKSGFLSAHVGTLWDTQTVQPIAGADFLLAHDDGRYGANCFARWDGDNLWAPGANWDQMKAYEEFLRPMLANYPEVPPGFDGWWTFKAGGKA